MGGHVGDVRLVADALEGAVGADEHDPGAAARMLGQDVRLHMKEQEKRHEEARRYRTWSSLP